MKLSDVRLSTRITAAALLIIIAVGALALFVELARLHDAYAGEQRADLQQKLRAEKARLGQAINTLRQDALFLSNIPPVSGIVRAALNHGYDARYGNTSKVWEERMQQIFAAFSSAHPDYYQLRFIGVSDGGQEIARIDNRHGRIVATPSANLQAKGDRDYFKATLNLHEGEVYLSEITLNQEGGEIERPYLPTLRAAVPVFAPSGKIFGMVVINMDAGNLLGAVASDLHAGIRAYVTNMDGRYLLHPDLRRSFGFELGSKDAIQTELPPLKKLFDPQVSGDYPPQAITTRAGTQFLAAGRIHFDPGHPERFLLLAYHIPETVVAAQVPNVPLGEVVGGMLILLLIAGIALLALRRTFAPLEQLASVATGIANGNRTDLLPEGGIDEIGKLSKAFNTMLEKLFERDREIRKINAGLEVQVAERSNELSVSNARLREKIDERVRSERILRESEERLSAIMKLLPVGVRVMDKNGSMVFENEAARKIWQGPHYAGIEQRGEYKGWRPASGKLIEPHEWAAARAIGKGEISLDEEIEIECFDGARKVILNSALPLMGCDGGISGAIVVNQDITGRKRAEMVLRQYKLMIDTAIDGFWMTDELGNVLEANKAYAKMSGYPVEELVNMHISQLEAIETSPEQVQAHIAKVIAHGYDRFETRHRHKDGHEIDVEISATHMPELGGFIVFCHDITERKKIEQEKIQESDLRFRGTLEQVAVGIVHASLDGRYQQVNQKFCEIIGYSREELLQTSFREITFFADIASEDEYLRQLLAGEISTFSREKRYVRKDRSLVWVNLTVSLLRKADGTPAYFIGVIEDIAERKHAEVLAQQFGHLLQSSFNEIYLFDAHTLHFLLASEGAERNLGYSADELNLLTPLDLTPSFNRDNFERLIASLRSGEQQSLVFETVHLRKDGTAYPVDVRLQLMEADYPVFMAIAQDITERRQADMELKQSRKLLRDLVAQSESLREDERKRIAREVHDELGQILTALRINVALLRIEFGGRDGALLEKIKGITELLDQSIQCARDVVANLRPAALDMGIVPAVRWLRDEFIRHAGIPCVLYAPEEEIRLDEILAVAAFRVVQESLTNAARYAEASGVEIILRQDADNFSVTVNDNGKGFDCMDISNRKSFGLLGMRERAIALGGCVNIYSAPQQGTQIFFVVPNKQTTTDTKGDNP